MQGENALVWAAWAMHQVQADDQGVGVGRDVDGSTVITGDHNRQMDNHVNINFGGDEDNSDPTNRQIQKLFKTVERIWLVVFGDRELGYIGLVWQQQMLMRWVIINTVIGAINIVIMLWIMITK